MDSRQREAIRRVYDDKVSQRDRDMWASGRVYERMITAEAALTAREEPPHPEGRLKGALRSVSLAYHEMTHDPNAPFNDCAEYMCVNVRVLLRDFTPDQESAREYPDLWLERARKSAKELHKAKEAHLADIAEFGRALTVMIGEGVDPYYAGFYERAGGGYEGLQAIARAVLDGLKPAALAAREEPGYDWKSKTTWRLRVCEICGRDAANLALTPSCEHRMVGVVVAPAAAREDTERPDAREWELTRENYVWHVKEVTEIGIEKNSGPVRVVEVRADALERDLHSDDPGGA